jgi:hypothetical protein
MQMQRQAALTNDLLRMLANLESDLRSVLMHEPNDSAAEGKAPDPVALLEQIEMQNRLLELACGRIANIQGRLTV